MRRVIKFTIAVAIVVAVVAILVHLYADSFNAVAQKYHSHRVVFVTLLFCSADNLVADYNRLAASASPVVQNAGRDLLAQTCTRLC
jgi:hypothetical protein